MSMSEPVVAHLSGRDHEELHRVAVAAAGPAAAVAMSCGRLPKRVVGVDPNEDAGLVAVGAHGVFAAVMDGHLGFDAAEETLEAVRQWAPELVSNRVDDPGRLLNLVLETAQKRIRERLAAAPAERRGSRTAVTLALADERRIHVVTLGDTAALLARRRRGRWVRFRVNQRFMGAQAVTADVRIVKRASGDRLIVASDGLVDFVPSGFVTATLKRPEVADEAAAEVARRLLDGALMGGAGDNVTVVCVDL